MTHEGLFNCDPVQKVSLVVNSHQQTHKRVNCYPYWQAISEDSDDKLDRFVHPSA